MDVEVQDFNPKSSRYPVESPMDLAPYRNPWQVTSARSYCSLDIVLAF